jgi:hypothetical protein
MIRAALSTFALPAALGDAANKVLLEAYNDSPATWRAFPSVKPTNDFKPHTGVRPSETGDLTLLPPGGEIKHGAVAEKAYSYSVDTFAKMLTIDRRDIINDDLSLFDLGTSHCFTAMARWLASGPLLYLLPVDGVQLCRTRNPILGVIPAVGYARRSTDMQERSIPDQQAHITKWAADNGYKINRWYIDDALSGTSTRGRDAFTEMIEAAEKAGDFETIICYDIARFSRGGTNETGYYIHRLKLAGVNVLFPSDSIPEGDEGELIQGVKSWQARQYSVKLARDSIRGQVSNIRERKSAPGGPPC